MDSFVERLKRYIATPSPSRGEARLADLVGAELAHHGFHVERDANNLWCRFGDRPRPRLLLNSHLDTVPPGQGWSRDPCSPHEEDGRIHGLGANDAKGCVVGLIEAAIALKRRLDRGEPLGGTVLLALTAEEEISGAGLSTILDRLRPLDAAIVGEPTALKPMIAQRGLLILRGVARGRSAHPASTPPESADNAILNAATALLRLRDFDWGPAHALLGRCHAHVTMIEGGVARNVIPDRCEFFIDVRTTPVEPHDVLYERLRTALRGACELHVHSSRLVPVATAEDEPIVQAVRAALPGVRPAGSPAMSDMVFLAGVPAVKIGPGDPARSHTPDEYVTRDELAAGAEAYERIAACYFAQPDRPADAPATARVALAEAECCAREETTP